MEINRTYTTSNGSYDFNSPEWIVVHYTAGAWGVTARANAEYFFREGGRVQSGTHFFLGDDGIFASTPEERGAWTNGNYEANTHSISIEVACGTDEPSFTETERVLLRELVTDLMGRYGIPAERVIRHHDVADHFGGTTYDPHKQCPRPYVDEGAWAELHEYITGGEDMTQEEFDKMMWNQRFYDGDWGKDGKGTSNQACNVWNVMAWDFQNILETKQAVAKLSAKVDKLSAGGATIDYTKLAKAVADELAARMKE